MSSAAQRSTVARLGVFVVLALLAVMAIRTLTPASTTLPSVGARAGTNIALQRPAQPASFLLLPPVAPLRYKNVLELAKQHIASPSTLRGVVPFVDSLYEFHRKPARLVVPEEFAPAARKMFAAFPGASGGSVDHVEHQTIVTVQNRRSLDYSMFNELRRYRPGYQERLKPELEEKVRHMYMSTAGADTCDFCSVQRTAEDPWGRIHGEHCYVASNVAKYEAQHGLLIAKKHYTLNVTAPVVEDFMTVAYRWFESAHKADSTAKYPHMMWDAGAKASASQPHLHIQMSILHTYYTRAEQTRRVAKDYYGEYGRGYWQDVVATHEAVGLAVRYGQCVVISSLTPLKERELIIIGPSGRRPCFARLIAVAVNTYVEDLGVRAFSMAVLPEPIGVSAEGYPAIARMVDRGSPLDARSDVGAMEFFGGFNVGADPFHALPFLASRAKDLPPL